MCWIVRLIEGCCCFIGVFFLEKWIYIVFFLCVVLRFFSILISEKDMCSFILVYFFEENRFFSNYGYYVIIEMIYGVLIVCCICFILIILKGIDYI